MARGPTISRVVTSPASHWAGFPGESLRWVSPPGPAGWHPSVSHSALQQQRHRDSDRSHRTATATALHRRQHRSDHSATATAAFHPEGWKIRSIVQWRDPFHQLRSHRTATATAPQQQQHRNSNGTDHTATATATATATDYYRNSTATATAPVTTAPWNSAPGDTGGNSNGIDDGEHYTGRHCLDWHTIEAGGLPQFL
jgi:hypothetical protein